ncbi:hypothetical protein F4780DRAFT_783036 [Xylariomycetidae sp. FL0641]|nr:hypothetical protein F4780DRAFT_783036 [Xylariomycetidae sp. FL0641]
MAAPGPLQTFTCFNALPQELRLIIWEFYFQAPRLHVVHPAPESHGRTPPREVLLFACTSLDAATSRPYNTPGAEPLPPNREALHVYLSASSSLRYLAKPAPTRGADELVAAHPHRLIVHEDDPPRTDTSPPRPRADFDASIASIADYTASNDDATADAAAATDLAWDLVRPYVERRVLGDGETLSEGQIEAQGSIPHFGAWRRGPGCAPRSVNWPRDLLYLCVPHAEQAYWSLRYVPWRSRVRRLAVLIPESYFEDGSRRPIPFGPSQFIREVLEGLICLEELFIVLVPSAEAAGADADAQRGVREALQGIPRDAFGFVSYVEYVRKVSVASHHMGYARAALSFQQALPYIPRNIRMQKVVDVDRAPSEYGVYTRYLRGG